MVNSFGYIPVDIWCVDWNCGSMASEKLLGIEIALLRHYRRREFAEVTFRRIACASLTHRQLFTVPSVLVVEW